MGSLQRGKHSINCQEIGRCVRPVKVLRVHPHREEANAGNYQLSIQFGASIHAAHRWRATIMHGFGALGIYWVWETRQNESL